MDNSDLTDGTQRIRLTKRIPGAAVDEETRDSVEAIAKQLGISMSQVSRLAHRYFAKNFSQYVKTQQQKG